MYPEDRVLVAYLPTTKDFEILIQEGWYRIPQQYAPKGIHAEYYAFYFGRDFGDRKWAIHYYAEQRGYELVRRSDLFPNQPNHPRAGHLYYKISLGPLQMLDHPIVSLRWRRITFMHTTWDRFVEAREINDLLIEGGTYVDRIFATLRDKGVRVERNYSVKEDEPDYVVPLAVFCRDGRIDILQEQLPINESEMEELIGDIMRQIALLGAN
jgi:hypothetical protein